MASDAPTEKKMTAHCGIYDQRPQVCKDYPKIDQYMPEECTFLFIGDKRCGSCNCDVSACCAAPKQDGEPGGAPMPSIAGGKPCKHLVWEEGEAPPLEKKAFAFMLQNLQDLVRGPSDT